MYTIFRSRFTPRSYRNTRSWLAAEIFNQTLNELFRLRRLSKYRRCHQVLPSTNFIAAKLVNNTGRQKFLDVAIYTYSMYTQLAIYTYCVYTQIGYLYILTVCAIITINILIINTYSFIY